MGMLYFVDIVVFFILVYYVDIFGNGEFFLSRLQCKSVLVIFLFFLCSHKCGISFTRFQASVFSSNMVFVWWSKMGLLYIFL